MPVRAGMGMDVGSVTRKRDGVLVYKAALHGRDNGCGAEYLMEKLFIIKKEFILGNSGFSHDFCNFRMSVGKFFTFPGLLAGFLFLLAEKGLSCQVSGTVYPGARDGQ